MAAPVPPTAGPKAGSPSETPMKQEVCCQEDPNQTCLQLGNSKGCPVPPSSSPNLLSPTCGLQNRHLDMCRLAT